MGRGLNRSRVDGNEDIKHGIGVEGVGHNGVCLLLVDEMKCSNVANVFYITSRITRFKCISGPSFNISRSFHSFILSYSIHPSPNPYMLSQNPPEIKN
jgi:hypothetical protein